MSLARISALLCLLSLLGLQVAAAQDASPSPPASSADVISQLTDQLRAQDARLKELEAEVSQLKQAQANPPAAGAAPPTGAEPAAAPPAEAPPLPVMQQEEGGGHNMSLGGGPVLNIRGFFDFNFGAGSIANPLVFPIINNGCGNCGNPLTPPHTAFQAGEFDLFLTSKLSHSLSFLAEVVLGPDDTNVFGPDIERYSLTYKANRYFSASAGRFHTSIGYYNTAYHHGDWFSTADGRPIMYLFEDSGGVLPVHMVGISFAGAVPDTEKLGLHWIAEVGNGRASDPTAVAVQNFYTDRNGKAVNLAGYIKPELLPGAQIGGSWYHDGLAPTGLPEIRENIESAYIVYFNSSWEFLNEGVLLSNHVMGMPAAFRSPMAYSQLAHKFGIYKPYFRYQYVRDNPADPVNILRGTYYGPSPGLRVDFSEYAAFKLQFNHLYQSNQSSANGLDAQIAFTF